MRVDELCTRDVQTIRGNESTEEAARRMSHEGVGSLVVVDEQGRATGIVTDRDLTLRAYAACVVSPWGAAVERFASSPLITIAVGDTLEVATERMRVRGVRRLPVVDADGRPAGMLALDDVLGALTGLLTDLSAEAVAKRRHAIWRGHLDHTKEGLEDAYEDVRDRLRSTAWYSREVLLEEIDALKERAKDLFGRRT